MTRYARPEALVENEWLSAHLSDPKVRVAEVDYDPSANYEVGHIPGALLIDWRKDVNHPVTRDLLDAEAYVALLRRLGVEEGTTLVLYGDFDNWFAAFAFWVFSYYGSQKVALLNGGRKKWIAEDRPLTRDVPHPALAPPVRPISNPKLRVFLDDVREALPEVRGGRLSLVDVRSSREFTGEISAPPEYPTEHAQRAGHIPGAVNIPWSLAVSADGTFKSREELERLYADRGISRDAPVYTYCRIGERSSHTWFVLTYLLGYPDVRNYDGSWTEWGNLVRTPIEREPKEGTSGAS